MSQVQNIPYAELEVGQKAEYTSSIAERDLQLFAAVSGDRNPVHLDAAYAATTQFKERIAHGMLSGALISAAIATVLPGPGTIYLGQTLRFTRPVKLGDDLKVELEVLEKLPKNRVRMATRVFNQAGKQVVDGEAEIMARRKRSSASSWPNCRRSASAERLSLPSGHPARRTCRAAARCSTLSAVLPQSSGITEGTPPPETPYRESEPPWTFACCCYP